MLQYNLRKKKNLTILFHYIKWEIGIYLCKQM